MGDLKPRGEGLLERGIHGLSMAGIPLALAVMTVIALATWAPQYPAGDATPLELRVIEDPDAALEPAQALGTLSGRPLIEYRDTKLAESPFWFSFTAQPPGGEPEIAIELPSRHAQEVQCWQAAPLAPLGEATRSGAAGRIRPVKAGFALELGALREPATVLCRATYSGPARISALQWRAESLAVSSLEFHRKAGLLEGGFVVLAGFVLVTALLTREGLYVIFAAWLIASMRLGALSAGWDMQWLEHTIPPEWLSVVRKLTIAAYVVLTYALFTRLFREDLRRIGHAAVLAVARWTCVALLAAAALLPFALFLRVMWVMVAVGIAALVYLLARILFVTRSRVALWYSASLAIVLFAGIYEVIAAALGAKLLIGAVNSVTAAFSSSLMVAVAIAEQLREERQQRVMAQAELRETYEALPIGLFTLDRTGSLVRGNPALYRILELDLARGDKAWSEHFEAGAWERMRANLQAGATRGMELRGAPAAEREPKVYFIKAAWTGDKIEGSLQDITERSKAIERLRYLADNDPLTGVLNRRGIEKVLGAAVDSLQGGGSIALAYLDLDRFKLINDLFGHVAGDEVLRQVCQRAKGMLGEGHQIGRIGGDEFVIVFRTSPVWLAAGTCRGIVDAVGGSPYQTGDKAVQVKVSIGLVEVPAGTRASDALALADRACRSAKAAQSDGLAVYERDSPAFGARARELRIFEHLGTGTAPRGLFLLMQPIMSLAAPYDSLDFEVLVRMRDPDNAVVPAGELLAAAESNGRAAVIDRWVLAHTLEWIEGNFAALGRTRFVCVNLSGSSLNDERFAQEAFALLARQRRACAKLCIEITEGVALRDLENTRRFIDRVRGLGSRVALDDFGAGYTSFSYLRDLPAEVLKIDGSFVTGVSRHPANLAIVEAIVELSRNLGMKTIAEWAEDSTTVASLAQVGVDYVQGYAIARPQDPAAILQAESSASFISDLEVAHYVRERLAGAYAARLWNESGETPSSGVH